MRTQQLSLGGWVSAVSISPAPRGALLCTHFCRGPQGAVPAPSAPPGHPPSRPRVWAPPAQCRSSARSSSSDRSAPSSELLPDRGPVWTPKQGVLTLEPPSGGQAPLSDGVSCGRSSSPGPERRGGSPLRHGRCQDSPTAVPGFPAQVPAALAAEPVLDVSPHVARQRGVVQEAAPGPPGAEHSPARLPVVAGVVTGVCPVPGWGGCKDTR